MTHRNTIEHLPVVMTTETVDDVTQATFAGEVTSSSSCGIEFYFVCAVVVIGTIGTAANALILYAMVASKQHKKNILIFNQNVTDFVSCLLLVITYALKLCNFYLTGLVGYWFCTLILSGNLQWCAVMASKPNLFFVTIERYLKVVYPVWSRNKLRNWMLYSAMAFAWISGFVHMNAITFQTTVVINGVCYGYVIWESKLSHLAYVMFNFSFFYITFLIIFVFCYWRILIVIRRQARVMAGHGTAGQSTNEVRSHRIKSNVIKTMILVSALYIISQLPINVYILLQTHTNHTLLESSYYATVFIYYLYSCANPFIYAAKFDPVKRILLRFIPCKTPAQPIETVDASPNCRTGTQP